MMRGEKVAQGCVVFPFDSEEFSESAGRGLYVKLVVLNDSSAKNGMCCGAYVVDLLNEPLIGDDKRPHPKDGPMPLGAPEEILACMEKEQREHDEWVAFHFPQHSAPNRNVEHLFSRDYRASILLGSTGWAGFSSEKGNWYAKFEDLTPEGKELYHLMGRLNPGCSLHILTFLDT